MTSEHLGNRSVPDPEYAKGRYFHDPNRHSEDAEFKARMFLEVFLPVADRLNVQLESYADVGCGSGAIAHMLAGPLRNRLGIRTIKAYDVSPHVRDLKSTTVEFVHADFTQANDFIDVVSLFDVFEHVTDPVGFLRRIAERCRVMVCHIPLDNSISNAIRNKFHSLLSDPGHLLFLDSVSALNLLTFAGLKVIEYRYTPVFSAPSGRASWLAKAILPLRKLMFVLSPWLMSRTVGGVGLIAIVLTPEGVEKVQVMESGLSTLSSERVPDAIVPGKD